jgi:redox-sensitive bicupin YhaK (pirin superfamily)
VRTVFLYDERGEQLDPFLLLDYAEPYRFEAAIRARGVGPHPHRGFETVTIAYQGAVTHRDSTGKGGTIETGDVQWMTAGSGILHQEFHSDSFTRRGGMFEMVQLWVNLPATHKSVSPRYQAIAASQIPVLPLANDAGQLRVIAGSYRDHKGPAETFSPINVWDVSLAKSLEAHLDVPEGHTTVVVALSGTTEIGTEVSLSKSEAALLSRSGAGVILAAQNRDARALILTGEPLNEPIVGRGPFVMNSEAEIREAFLDFGLGRFGALSKT